MKSDLDLEGMLVGALFASSTIERAKKVISAIGTSPATFQDPVARASMAMALDLLGREELPSAATVFVEGSGGPRHLFNAGELERLRGWQAGDALTDGEIVQIGRQLHRKAQHRKLGDMLTGLGAAVKHGRDKNGQPFGPGEARVWFDQIARDYNTSFAAGIRGSDAVLMTRAAHEQRLKDGRSNFTKTGIPVLDKVIGGWPHKLSWVLGPGGGGKSTFLGTQIDLHQVMGVKSVLASMEDNHEWVVTRHVALGTGLKFRETYSGPFPDELKASEVERRLHDSWKNLVIITKQHARSIDDLLRIFAQYIVQEGASVFYVDNLTALEHQLQGKNDTVHAAAARSVEKLAAFADQWHVAVVALAHTKNEYFERTRGQQPPEMRDTADTGGGIAADRFARLGYGVWAKSKGELRLTVNKNTAEGKLVGSTFAFDVHSDQGLIDVDSGREVNLEQEKRLEADERNKKSRAKRDDEARRTRERNKAWAAEDAARKAAAKAAELAKQPAQGTLLDVETPKERT